MRIECWYALEVVNACFFCQFSMFNINLLKGFDMFRDKANWYYQQIFNTLLTQFLKRILSVGFEPLYGTNSTLISQSMGVGAIKSLHDECSTIFNFLLVRVTHFCNVAYRDTVGTEENMNRVRVGKLVEFLGN